MPDTSCLNSNRELSFKWSLAGLVAHPSQDVPNFCSSEARARSRSELSGIQYHWQQWLLENRRCFFIWNCWRWWVRSSSVAIHHLSFQVDWSVSRLGRAPSSSYVQKFDRSCCRSQVAEDEGTQSCSVRMLALLTCTAPTSSAIFGSHWRMPTSDLRRWRCRACEEPEGGTFASLCLQDPGCKSATWSSVLFQGGVHQRS